MGIHGEPPDRIDGLLGGVPLGTFITQNWAQTCSRTWMRLGASFGQNLSAQQLKAFGFALRAQDDNAIDCLPGAAENAALVLFAAECRWVNGIANTPDGQASWETHDQSMLKLSRLTPVSCPAGVYPCNQNGLARSSAGECYDPSCKSPYALVYVC